MKVNVGVSNRHVHLKKQDLDILFGTDLTIKNKINQPGQFACNEVVTIKTEKSEINNVRVLGPTRNYTQIEISKTDAYKLGINPPVRSSGCLENSEVVTIIGPKGSIKTNGCIIADRHLHITNEDGTEKESAEADFEVHLDTDDANAFLLKNGDEVEILDV